MSSGMKRKPANRPRNLKLVANQPRPNPKADGRCLSEQQLATLRTWHPKTFAAYEAQVLECQADTERSRIEDAGIPAPERFAPAWEAVPARRRPSPLAAMADYLRLCWNRFTGADRQEAAQL